MNFIYNKNEYAVTTWTLEHMTLKDALNVFDRYGFKNIEIWADTVHLDPRCSPDIKEIKNQIRSLGMQVHSVHGPFRNYKNPPSEEEAFRRFRTDTLKKTIDYAYELGCSILVMHALDRKEYNYSVEQLPMVQDYIGEIARYGVQNGVQLAIEDIPPGKKSDEICTTLENQKKIFGHLGVKYCLDIGHVPLLGADLFRETDAAGSDLITFHIHNNSGISDDHYLPDNGIIDWPQLHDYIRSTGFQGEFVLEIYGGTDREGELDTLRRMDSLFK
ncbi:MAG: sugar phosphate isomerase/epimerase [Hungatella sp.]|nr:sugar phosphate isomerase/epimerase [Hungatella sp.]